MTKPHPVRQRALQCLLRALVLVGPCLPDPCAAAEPRAAHEPADPRTAQANAAADTVAVRTPPVEPARSRPRTALVLGGGGARGVAEVGALQALEELHIPVDLVIGTSMGAIVGGAYSAGVTPGEMERRLHEVSWDALLSDVIARDKRSVLSKEQERDNIRSLELGYRDGRVRLPRGAIAGHEFELFLGALLGTAPRPQEFDKLPIPYRAIATDIETGDMVVLQEGDLQSAIRASMAVPGVFSPVEIDGRLLVDGGLTRNLPIDVARGLGVDRLIAIDVGSPLLKRDEIASVIGVSEQILYILGHQNVRASLAELTPADVLVKVGLGNFSVADFEHSTSTIAQGRVAVLAQAPELASFRVSDADWADYLGRRADRGALPAGKPVLKIDTGQLAHVNPRSVQALMESREGQAVDPVTLAQDINRLYATDDFQQIRTRVVPNADGTSALVLQPVEKEWGPNYVNLDLDLSTDLQGSSRFNARVATRSTWLDQRGLEWRNSFSLGAINEWSSELYQPIDFSRTLFVAPRLDLRQERNDLYQNDVAISSYTTSTRLLGLDLGRRFGTSALLRVGAEIGGSNTRPAIAQTTLPSQAEHVGDYRLRLDIDTLDRWSFPSSGSYVHADLRSARPALGSDQSYDRGELEIEQAMHWGEQDVRLGLLGGSSFGTQLPVQQLFPLGGFLQLSGYQEREFLGQRYLLGRLITYRSLGDPGALTRRLYVGGSIEAGNVFQRFNGDNVPGLRRSGSLFIGADTGIGPLYLGFGLAGNSRSAYLFLGRP